ncbi:MAG: cytochrome-c oxidase, cbb3-type subunit I [Saprospiraceae bacterium]
MTKIDRFYYDNNIVRKFAIASILFGVVGLLVGLIIAFELFIPGLNMNTPWLTFGRLRPLHTNAAIFAFVGNAIFTGVYYSTQRLVKARMYSDVLSNIHFWGWQLVIVLAAITLPLGYTSSHEYAELEWPIDILIAVVWVIFGINLIMTLLKRRESHIYVAIWFYISTWITVTMLHIGNNLEVPWSFFKSYPVFAGVHDALIQWWYGHNAVAFFLTTPYLGLMYYFVPKAANRPIYSYKLSIIHFWTLIFIYIWAGPHHLLYSALPDWAQSLGTVMSIMLIAPSWGGMLNGLLTLRGAWDKVRQDPVLKFFVVAVTAYGMSTFEGPMMSIKSVNAITHFTDWTVAHVHVGTLGWNGMLSFGMFYYLFPKLYNTKLYSVKMAEWHFWLATIGIIFWVTPMYWAGITQQLMWKQFNPDGTLVYGNFLDTVTQLIPMYTIRAIGGTIYFTGLLMAVYNLWKTAAKGSFVKNEEAEAPALEKIHHENKGHRWIESRMGAFYFWSFVAVFIGGMIEIIPTILVKSNVPTISTVEPYTPLELEGRDIYIREGCVSCHSQLVRPFRSETARYGQYSKAGEFIYDRPFLWGSKRTGIDLARVGGKYPNKWHYDHLFDPRSTSSGSIMPRYPWLQENDLTYDNLENKINVLRMLGTPYAPDFAAKAADAAKAQAKVIADNLKSNGVKTENLENKEIVALIAYLQRLGTDIKKSETTSN